MCTRAHALSDRSGRISSVRHHSGRTILDDGVRQEVAPFGSVQVPLDMVLVFDTSSSMAAALPAVKSGARGLLGSLRDTMNGRRRTVPHPRGSSGPTAAVPRAAPATGLAAAVQQRALCVFSHIVGGIGHRPYRNHCSTRRDIARPLGRGTGRAIAMITSPADRIDMFASAADNEISMAHMLLEDISKNFGTVAVIEHLDLRIEDRDFLVLVRPSGCGKLPSCG
jgi:hypothetical protein